MKEGAGAAGSASAWRAATTHAELFAVWIDAASIGYGPAFEKVRTRRSGHTAPQS
jgi:hypothetical protein